MDELNINRKNPKKSIIPGFTWGGRKLSGVTPLISWNTLATLQEGIPYRTITDRTHHTVSEQRGWIWSDNGIAGCTHGPYPSLESCFYAQALIPLGTYYIYAKYPSPDHVAQIQRKTKAQHPTHEDLNVALEKILGSHDYDTWLSLPIEEATIINQACFKAFSVGRDDEHTDVVRAWLRDREALKWKKRLGDAKSAA